MWNYPTSEGWQGVRKVVIAEVEAERQAAEKRGKAYFERGYP